MFSEEFKQYFKYIKSLKFMDLPDYEYLKGLFRDLYERQPPSSVMFDWEKPSSETPAGRAEPASIEGVRGATAATAGDAPQASEENVSSQAPAEDSSLKKGF